MAGKNQKNLDIDIQDITEKMNHMEVRIDNFLQVIDELYRILEVYESEIDPRDREALVYDEAKRQIGAKRDEMRFGIKNTIHDLHTSDEHNLILSTYYAVAAKYDQLFANFFNPESEVGQEMKENIEFAVLLERGVDIDPVTGTFKMASEIKGNYTKGKSIYDAILAQMNHGFGYRSASGKITFLGSNEFIKQNYGGNVRWMTKTNFLEYNLQQAKDQLPFQKGTGWSTALMFVEIGMAGWGNRQAHLADGDMERAGLDTIIDTTAIVVGTYTSGLAFAAGSSAAVGFVTFISSLTCPPVLAVGAGMVAASVAGWFISWLGDQVRDPFADFMDWSQDQINNLKDWSVGY